MPKEIEIKEVAFPGTRQFSYTFEELPVIPADLEILMGFQANQSPEPFPAMIESALEEAKTLFDISAGYRRVPGIVFKNETRQLVVGQHQFSPGKIVFSQVRKSLEIAFFMATAGAKVSLRCKELNKSEDTVYSYVLDVLGSVVAEKAVEKLTDQLQDEVLPLGWKVSDSYSPGYCNWDVSEQQEIFSLFPDGFCGIRLSPSSLMYPIKSISGIIGIGPSLNRKGYQCHLCHDQTCIYGRIRRENFRLQQ
jgi:hypothetical protein